MEIILNETIEEFKEYGENYLVSNWGRVYSKRSSKFLKATKHSKGYYVIDFCENGKKHQKRIHRIVYELFGDLPDDYWDNPDKYHIHHIDENKKRNMLTNLECKKNDEHQRLHKIGNTYRRGKKHTEEAINKMSEAKKGKHHTEETKNKISETMKRKRFRSKITVLEKNEIIEKIIAYKAEGLTNAAAFRLLAKIYPLKPGGIKSIWRAFLNKKREG